MRQQLLILPLAATVLTVAWLFSVPVANAQTQSPSPSPSCARFSLKNVPITSDMQAVLLNDRNQLSV